MDDLEVFVGVDGEIEFVYSDALADVFRGEHLDVRRASHVEPHPMFTGSGWIVDMRPVGGRIFGENGVEVDALAPPDIDRVVGFSTRQAALDAEIAWIRAQLAERPL